MAKEWKKAFVRSEVPRDVRQGLMERVAIPDERIREIPRVSAS